MERELTPEELKVLAALKTMVKIAMRIIEKRKMMDDQSSVNHKL